MGCLFSRWAKRPTHRGNPTLGAPVDPNPANPTSSRPEGPGTPAPNTFRSEPPIHRGNPTPGAPVDPNPTSFQPEAPGAQASNTFRSEPPSRRANPTPGAPVDPNPANPTSPQPEGPGTPAPNTFRSEPPIHRSLEAISSALKNVEHLFIRPQRLKFKEGSQVGAGGFGVVVLATLDKSKEVAIKQLRVPGLIGSQERLALHLARELRIWATLQHPNILRLLGYYLSKDYETAQLVSVYMVNGNVSQYLDQNQPDITTRLKFVRGITSGLQYLHDFTPPICHGDLKPLNVLISDELDAVLCDFGVASVIDEAAGPSGLTTTRTVKGSLPYMSPELLLELNAKHTLPSDIWAWACTTYEIFTSIGPYREKAIGVMILEMHQKKPPGPIEEFLSRLPQDENWPRLLSEVIKDCWNFESSKRPTVTTLIGVIKYPINRNPVNPPSSRSKSPVGITHGGTAAHVQSIEDGADSGYHSGQALTRGGLRHLPDRSARDSGRVDSAHQGSRNGASVDQNPTSSQSEAQAQPPSRRGNQTTPGAPVSQHPTHPTPSQPEAPGAQALNTFRSESSRRGNPISGAPVDPDSDPANPTSSQPEAPDAQAPNTFRSEPPTHRSNPTPGAPDDPNPTNPTSSKSEVQAQLPTRRGNPTMLGAPVDQNPTNHTSSQPEAPGAQAPNTFRSETPIRRGNSSRQNAPVDQNPTRAHPASSRPGALGAQAPNTFRSEPPTRRGNHTPDAPVSQNPTHSTSSQPEALGNQAQSTFLSEPPTRRSNHTTPGAPLDQNPSHPMSSLPEAPISITQKNTSSNHQTLSINNGADPGSNFGPDPAGDIPPGSRRYPDPNEKDKARGNFTRQGPTHGTPINQDSTTPPSSRSETCVGIGQGVTFANIQSTKHGPDSGSNARPAPTPAQLPDQSNRVKDRGDSAYQGSRNGALVDQNRANPTLSQSEAPVSVTQENTSSNLQTLSINNGAGFGSNSYLGPKKKEKGRGDSTRQGPTHGAPINQNSANPPSSRSDSPVGITQGSSSANLQSAKNGLNSGSNSRLAPVLARYLDRIEKENSRDPRLPYSEAPVGVTEWGTVIYADLGFNSVRGLGGDDQLQTDKSKGSSTGQELRKDIPTIQNSADLHLPQSAGAPDLVHRSRLNLRADGHSSRKPSASDSQRAQPASIARPVAPQPAELDKESPDSSLGSRPQHRFSLSELRDGLLSTYGKWPQKLDALDYTGQLSRTTAPKSTGSFSDVSQARLGGRLVAVKELRAVNMDGPDEIRMRKRLGREIYVWASLHHPYVLEFLGFAFENGRPCLISPWCEHGTLPEYLQKYHGADRRLIVRQIAEGLKYIHVQDPPVIHGDFKTANVLITDKHIPKIYDFGGSKHLGESGTNFTTAAGLGLTTIRYTAPEILREGLHHTLQSDVYSFSCVALETMTNNGPFWKIPNSLVIISKVVFEKQTPSPDDHPELEDDKLWELLRQCWSHEPSDRPTMITVCNKLAKEGYGQATTSYSP